jgi:hypothetical protein
MSGTALSVIPWLEAGDIPTDFALCLFARTRKAEGKTLEMERIQYTNAAPIPLVPASRRLRAAKSFTISDA